MASGVFATPSARILSSSLEKNEDVIRFPVGVRITSTKKSYVPLSVPGPYNLIRRAGQDALSSLHRVTWGPAPPHAPAEVFDVQIRQSCFTVRVWTQSLDLGTTIVRPSYPILNSVMFVIGGTWAAHMSRSDCLIGRDASLRSVSPRQNFWKPPPVPLIATVTWRCGLLKSLAHAAVMGYTVLLPSMTTISKVPRGVKTYHAATPPTAASTTAIAMTVVAPILPLREPFRMLDDPLLIRSSLLWSSESEDIGGSLCRFPKETLLTPGLCPGTI